MWMGTAKVTLGIVDYWSSISTVCAQQIAGEVPHAYGSLHTWNLLAGLHRQHWSWTVLTPPILSPRCWRHSWDGWAMSLGWRNIACHEVWHMVSWLLAKDTWVVQRNATKTQRAIFIGAISSRRTSNLVLEIVCFGAPGFIKLPPPLKTPAANDLLQSACHATRLHLQWPQPNSTAPLFQTLRYVNSMCSSTLVGFLCLR